MRLLECVFDPKVHLTLAVFRLRSGDEVSRMCSPDPREQLARPWFNRKPAMVGEMA